MSLKNKKILVTYGPTWVAIDDMRVISNRSSGAMGKLIVRHFIKAGAKVTALEGPVAESLNDKKVTVKKFIFFDELADLFKIELKKNYDAVIHAAAVSDFKPLKKFKGKLASDQKQTLALTPTPKLIKLVKKISPEAVLVGFKLESSALEHILKKEALNSIRKNRCDYVVANSISNGYRGFIFSHEGVRLARVRSRRDTASAVIKILTNHFDQIKISKVK